MFSFQRIAVVVQRFNSVLPHDGFTDDVRQDWINTKIFRCSSLQLACSTASRDRILGTTSEPPATTSSVV